MNRVYVLGQPLAVQPMVGADNKLFRTDSIPDKSRPILLAYVRLDLKKIKTFNQNMRKLKYDERLFIKLPKKEKALLKELAALQDASLSFITRKLLYGYINQMKSVLQSNQAK